MRRTLPVVTAAALLGAVLPVAGATAAPRSAPQAAHPSTSAPARAEAGPRSRSADVCAGARTARVPGADEQVVACLGDLTTAGLVAASTPQRAYTDPADWAGLHAAGTRNPTGVPGAQIDGYFADTSTTNTTHGWNHDSQFVLRMPREWNGGLVITGSPGVREQYANDFIISDAVLAQGYAFASIDKGNTGAFFYRDGEEPGDAIREWHERVSQLAKASQKTLRQVYGHRPTRTYMTGISNGGYLTRWQLENRPGLFDGGVDWEGTLFEEDNNLLDFLPEALRAYPRFRDAPDGSAEKEAARQAMYDAGFEPGSEFLWPLHYDIYWDLTQRIYREELDPSYDGALEASVTPQCGLTQEGCAADVAYRLEERPAAVREAFEGITLTGKIKRPLLSLHGDLDALLPIDLHGDRYRELVEESHRARLHRYYVVERGQHVDGFYALYGDRVRPILPCYRDAFAALVAWVERGEQPPASGPVERASDDVVNDCTL